jgi:tellurium resistance protein TerZ
LIATEAVAAKSFFNQKTAPGIQHCGDNRTGQGAGDDEIIMIDLLEVQNHVNYLYFTVNIYAGGSFRDVKNSYIRLVWNNKEVARYILDERLNSQGVIFGCLQRKMGGWVFLALGEPCGGRICTDIYAPTHWT